MTQPTQTPVPTVEVITFGFGHGPAPEAHVVLDLRAHFRDPHVSPILRELTARDASVRDAVMATPGIRAVIRATVDLAIGYLRGPGTSTISIAIGCAGGRHRAATVGHAIANHLANEFPVQVDIHHRDLDKPVIDRPVA